MTHATSVPFSSNCPRGGHIRVPYADLGRPPVSLWEHHHAVRMLREQGRKTVDEYAIFTAIEEQRHVLTERKCIARRLVARYTRAWRIAQPTHARANCSRTPCSGNCVAPDDALADDARVPTVAEDEAWKTEFLS